MYAPSSPPSTNAGNVSISSVFCVFSVTFVLSPLPPRSLSSSSRSLSSSSSFFLLLLLVLSLSLSKCFRWPAHSEEIITTKKTLSAKTKRERNRFWLFCKKDKTLDIFLCFILLLCRVAKDPNFSLSLQMLSCTQIVMSCFHVSPVAVTRHVSPVTPPSINHVFTASQK